MYVRVKELREYWLVFIVREFHEGEQSADAKVVIASKIKEVNAMSSVITSPEERHIAMSVGTGSTAEIIGGAAVVVLTILGLANVAPSLMFAVATIAIGVAILFEGGSVAAEYSHLVNRTADNTFQTVELGSGMTVEMVAGITGIVLGVLSLLDIVPVILTAAAVIVYGVALILSSGMTLRLNDLKFEETADANPRAQRLAHEAINASVGAQILIGLAASVLGILALVGVTPTALVLVALLAIGTSLLLSGGAVGGRIISMFRR